MADRDLGNARDDATMPDGVAADTANMPPAKIRLLVPKHELLADTAKLHGLLEQYCGFLDTIAPGASWTEAAQQLLRNHVQFLEQSRISIQSLELAAALIRHVLDLRPGDTLAIPVRTDRDVNPGFAADSTGRAPSWPDGPDSWRGSVLTAAHARHAIAQINALSRNAPIAIHERLRFLLNGLLRFLEMQPDPDPNDLEQVLSEINLLTSDRESRHLVREVAKLTRDVYNSVKSVSDGLPLETLLETTDGATEAVRKLHSVIQRLEEAATQNLDQLEKVGAALSTDSQAVASVQAAARHVQLALAKAKAAHPEIAEALDPILDRLGNDVGSALMQVALTFDRESELVMHQVAHQSFQDLSSATLKRIIAFVESTQMELLAVLNRYRDVLKLVESDGTLRQSTPIPTPTAAPDSEASQDEVDRLLAEHGF
jgi:chemotaxis regulatin CheY-phosphate phosphatase CheZ